MGKRIEQIASLRGHSIALRYKKSDKKELEPAQIASSDIVVDFSHASSVLSHLSLSLSLNKPIVIGTTGWEHERAAAEKMVKENHGSCLFSPNFSIGAFLFRHLVERAAHLFDPFEDYDVAGLEIHRRCKPDSPSGTAKELSRVLANHMPNRKEVVFASIRCGQNPGLHTVYFDGSSDAITLTHEARNRDGFAHGAVKGAEWLLSRKGFFTMDDWMRDQLCS